MQNKKPEVYSFLMLRPTFLHVPKQSPKPSKIYWHSTLHLAYSFCNFRLHIICYFILLRISVCKYWYIWLWFQSGNCRVMSFDSFNNALVVSMPSPNQLFPGFGVKKVRVVSPPILLFFGLIRYWKTCSRFHETLGLILSRVRTSNSS